MSKELDKIPSTDKGAKDGMVIMVRVGDRALGNYYNFFANILFGVFCPLLSIVLVVLMETPYLSRIGVMVGSGNCLLWIAMASIREYSLATLFAFLLSAVMHFGALMVWRTYCNLYLQEIYANERTKMRSSVPVGTDSHFVKGFLLSFFLPVVGALITYAALKYLHARFGAVFGLSTASFLVSLVLFFFPTPVWTTANFAFWFGIVAMECSVVHFWRLTMSANINAQVRKDYA